MVKKFCSAILTVLCVLSLLGSAGAINASAAMEFSDLPSTHWAYGAVSTLVEEGTIRGYEDGSFKPNNTVTRAEFVKMIGKGSERRQTDYEDVPPEHWAYEYVMTSGFDVTSNTFEPDRPITRGETINLLWKRAGSPKNYIVPSIITNNVSNRDAVAWIYATGVMVGNDGVNLRTGDTLTRAEAAALIIKARGTAGKINFVDVVSDDLLKAVYNGVRAFDTEYSPDKTITNGELAKAALRIGTESYNVSYTGAKYQPAFEHKYSKNLAIVANECLGADKNTPEFIDKAATKKDALTVLTHNMIKKSHKPLPYGATDKYYSGISSVDSKMMNICLTFAKEIGVELYADGALPNADSPVTLKEIAAMLLQLDSLIGTQTNYTTAGSTDKITELDTGLLLNMAAYPENYEKYMHILKNVPKEVYTAPFRATKTNPKGTFDVAREFSPLFTDQLKNYKKLILENTGVTVDFTYMPSLVYEGINCFVLRVRCDVTDVPADKTIYYKDIFDAEFPGITFDTPLTRGMSFYTEIVITYGDLIGE